jgi:signal transduction histidine kinase/DNA-binding response OmpR family regulator/ligand-binding sensor domain-containing protein
MFKRFRVLGQFGKIKFLIVAMLLLTLFAIGQKKPDIILDKSVDISPYSIRQLTIIDDLPSNVITGIVKDDNGFMWFGTSSGLCRWDGFSALVYKHSDADSNTIISDVIPRNGLIYDASRHNLIIGTKEGISFFHPDNQTFANHPVELLKPNSLPSPVNVVYSDKQGILWAGTDKGFSRYRPDENDFMNYQYSQNIPAGILLDRNSLNIILDIRQDMKNDSILWLASLAGLLKFNKYTEALSWFYFYAKNYLREINQFTLIVPHPNGNLYLGTWNFDMAVFDIETETFTGRFGSAAHEKYSLHNRILPYAISPDNGIWVSSLEGLGILNSQTGQIHFIQSFKNESGHRFAPELFYTDKEGQLWLGSEFGVCILKPGNHPVSNYFFNPRDEDHWYLTLSLLEDTLNHEILIGYGRGEGLHIFNIETGRFTIIPYQQRVLSEFNITGILLSQTGEIYFLAADEMYLYDPLEKKIVALDYPYDDFPAFTDIKQDSKGNIWIASQNSGLQHYNPEKRTVEYIRNWNTIFKTGRELPLFAEICIDSENRIWFRRRGESYGYYDPVTDSVRYFDEPGKRHDVTGFDEPARDTIWVAIAHGGLGFIDTQNPDRGVTPAIAFENAYSGNIQDIVFDLENRLWCLTDKGLFVTNTRGRKPVLFDENYGIPIRDPWSNKSALVPGQLKVLADGRMVIGYRRGLGIFHPDSLCVLYTTPEPYLISIRIFDKEISLDDNPVLKLSYDENYVSFRYSALDLYNVGTTFRHQLSGVDQDWHENQPVHEATYPNLHPGNYRFVVQAISTSGYGLTKELIINFSILPPWWKTVWAYAIFLLMVIMLLFVFYRFQLNRQLAHREALKLRELDELKTRLYSNITHEFRTPITLIMGMAEELVDSFGAIGEKHFRKKLETIQKSGGNLLHLVNQLLDLARLEHGKLNYSPIRTNIIPWFQYIVESHQFLAATKEIQLTFYSETESLVMDYDPDQLMKVISNLLTNAIKFTGERGKVICHTRYEFSDNSFHIKVKDNGIGIPENEQSRIFGRFYQVESSGKQNRSGTGIGLSLTMEIVEMISGTITVKSQPGKGSEFEVILPVTRNAPETSTDPSTFERPLIPKTNRETEIDESGYELRQGEEKSLILVAEDNPDVANYIRDTIRMQYKVKWAPDGDKALQMAFDLIPDLVITDVMMPGKDGLEVCNTLKQDQRTDHIPVIMLTAKVADNDRITGYERGADAYLTKPFNKKELLVRLEQLLKLRRQLQAKFSKLDLKAEYEKPLNPKEQFIRKAAQFVEANLEKSIFNATDLADKVNLSESQLYRKLKAISGKSTAIFIRTVRLKKARELLETSNLSISEIAYQVGFNDPAWFSRVFKEEFGVSPTEARENFIHPMT